DPSAAKNEAHAVTKTCEPMRRDLVRTRRGLTLDAAHSDAIRTDLFDLERIETRDGVGVRVARPRDLVENLRLDRRLGYEPAGPLVFGDGEAAVFLNLSDREPRALEIRDFLEASIVAARRLWAAFEDMPGDDRRGDRIVIVVRPTKMVDGGAHDERSVGHTRTDHQISARIERFGNTARAEIGVRCKDGLFAAIEAFARLHSMEKNSLFFERS